MNTRHRNGPWRGYRSNAMGNGGVAFASRISISPERNRRVFSSERTNNDRGGYRRGGVRAKPFQPPVPLAKSNVFVEAGILAAEYLVSRGVLPPNVIPGNWRKGEVENRDVAAHSLSRSASLDAESSRRYEHDKNLAEGRRRSESFNISGSEVNRESGKSGTCSERTSIDVGIEGSAGHRYEQSVGNDGLQNLSPNEANNCDGGIILETEVQKCNPVEDGSTNASSFNNEKSLPSDASLIPVVESDDTARPTEESIAVKMEINENDLEQVNGANKITDHEGEDANVATDTRSSLTRKSSDHVQDDMNEDGSISEREKSEVSGVRALDISVDHSTTNPLSYENQNLRNFDSNVIDGSAIGDKPDVTYTTKLVQRCGSLSGRSVLVEQKPDEGVTDFDSVSSMLINKSSKRTLNSDNDSRDSFKRLKEWFPSTDTHVDSSQQNQLAQQEPLTSQSEHATTLSDDQKSLNVLLFPRGHGNSSELLEERQLFSGSFQTWDLNLLVTSDCRENHDSANPVIAFPPFADTGKEAVPIDVDLSMSNNRNQVNNKGKHGINNNDIEVIDLEDESAQEGKRLDDPKGRGDTVFADQDSFRRNSTNEIHNVHGDHGFMMSELFGNGSPNISSVAANLNSLPNNMSLSNGEGILGDDDSIYMSLGEIPSSQLGPWEHPNQDYRKSF